MDLFKVISCVVLAVACVCVCVRGQVKCDSESCNCDMFKICVGCIMFGTVKEKTYMECLNECSELANFIEVTPTDFDNDVADYDGSMVLCKRVNEENCVESFKIGDITQGYRDLYVRNVAQCPKYEPPTTRVVVQEPITTPVTVVAEEDSTTTKPEPTDPNPEAEVNTEKEIEEEEEAGEEEDEGEDGKGETLKTEKAGAVAGSNQFISDTDNGAVCMSSVSTVSAISLCFVSLILSL